MTFVIDMSLASLTLSLTCSIFASSIFLLFVGTSDPYVKFKIAGKEVFRSKTIHKNLNPVWDERVSLLVETMRDPLYVKVNTCILLLLLFFNRSQDECCLAQNTQIICLSLTLDLFFAFVGFWLWLWTSGWFHGLCIPPPGVPGTPKVCWQTLKCFNLLPFSPRFTTWPP